MDPLEQVSISFSPSSLRVLNACLAFIMFGVALSLKPAHFKAVLTNPASIGIGVFSQLILLPTLTFVLVVLLKPAPGLALGMFLVAACPGGNLSNYFSLMGNANAALSVSLTAVSTMTAAVCTPFLFRFWGGLYGPTADLLQRIDVTFSQVLTQVLFILTLPVAAGILTAWAFPNLTKRVARSISHLSFLMLLAFIVAAFYANADQFVRYIGFVVGLVFVHNATALASGYTLARGLGRPTEDCRSIAIETGIQNSGLGLVLIFTFFQGNGPMALVAAWWGIWHMLAGGAVAYWFTRRDRRPVSAATEAAA